MKRWLTAAVLTLGLAGVAHAAIDTYEFANDAERERFRDLTQELRCPKCQNRHRRLQRPDRHRPAQRDFPHAGGGQGRPADHRLHGRPLR